jgi:hypothetical protein
LFSSTVLTVKLSAIVGAPTFLFLCAIRESQGRPAPQPHPGRKQRASLLRRASRGGPYTNFELSTFDFEPLLFLFRLLLNLKLTTGHPVKDAHPERAGRGGRVEGSLPSLAASHPLLSLFRILLNLKLTTDYLKLPTAGNLNRAADWCHDAGAPGVRSPAWVIVQNLESSRSTAGAKCPKN